MGVNSTVTVLVAPLPLSADCSLLRCSSLSTPPSQASSSFRCATRRHSLDLHITSCPGPFFLSLPFSGLLLFTSRLQHASFISGWSRRHPSSTFNREDLFRSFFLSFICDLSGMVTNAIGLLLSQCLWGSPGLCLLSHPPLSLESLK